MAVVEVKVTKFKARDGRLFDEKVEAVDHDMLVGICDLLHDRFDGKEELTHTEIYKFLGENRDEIIEIMGWEYENAND